MYAYVSAIHFRYLPSFPKYLKTLNAGGKVMTSCEECDVIMIHLDLAELATMKNEL